MNPYRNAEPGLVGRLAGCAAVAALALAGATPAEAQEITIRLAHHLPTQAEQHGAAESFAERLAEKTDGRVQVEILPGAQLGGQREIIEGVTLGTIEMGFGESGLYAAYAPKFSVIALPYLYTDHDHWIAVVDGPVGEELEQELIDAAGIRVVNWMMTGFRDTYLRTRPVERPEDFKGIRIRLPEAPVFVQTFEAVGAVPTPIPAPEMYTALQTGVVDAMEGTPEVGYTWDMYEVTSYLSRTRHIFLDGSFVINEAFFQGLPEDVQSALLDAAEEAAEEQRGAHIEREQMWFDRLANETDLVINDVDLSLFAEAVRPMHERVAAAADGEHLLEQIRAAGQR